MKIIITTLCALLIVVSITPCHAGESSAVRLNVDWPSFLRSCDLQGDALPQSWKDAPMFGNATLGSMIYHDGNALRLALFHAEVNDHRDNTYGWTAYRRPRFEIGALKLNTIGKIQSGEWHLDLWNAELTGHVVTDRGKIRFRHFVHAERLVMVTELWNSGDETYCHWSWHPGKAETTRDGYPSTSEEIEKFAGQYGEHYRQTLKPYLPNPQGVQKSVDWVEVWQQDLHCGGQYATAWSESDDGAHRILLTSVASSYPQSTATDEAIDAVKSARAAGLPELVRTHQAWWHDYYPRVARSLLCAGGP
jgi:alpha-L-fucosidase 2